MDNKPDPIFQPLLRDALSRKIARILTDAIVAGQLKPGERVAESVIARDLGVSRAPVREAGRLLESAGLLTSEPNRGFFVRTFDSGDLESMYELRLCIEREAAARLVRLGKVPLVIGDLRRQVDMMIRFSDEQNLMEQVSADLHFHRIIVEGSGNRRFLSVFDQIVSEIRACVALIERVFDAPGKVAKNHRLIITALESGDEPQVRAAMDYHINVAREAIVSNFRALENSSPPK